MPSGLGLLLQTDRADVIVSHDLSETLTAFFSGSGYPVSGITQSALGGTLEESRYFTATPAIAWKFSEWWKLELSYTYRRREAVNRTSDPSMSNATMFMLTYIPPKLAFSN